MLKKIIALLTIALVAGTVSAATMTSGYTIGSSQLTPGSETLFVDYSSGGGSDVSAATGFNNVFTVLIDGLGQWAIGDTVEITGFALFVRSQTVNGTMTFEILQGAGGIGTSGAGTLATLGTATATYTNPGSNANMYVNFDTPVSFVVDANSTKIGINISNSGNLRLKHTSTFEVPRYNKSNGNLNSAMKVSVAGIVTPSGGPNNPPTFNSDPFAISSAARNKAYSKSMLSYATDLDGNPMEFTVLSGPAWLGFDGTSATGTPLEVDSGFTNTWNVQVNDDQGGTNTATMTAYVWLNHKPTFTTNVFSMAGGQAGVPYSDDMMNYLTDNNGDPLELTTLSFAGPGSDWMGFDGTSVTGTPQVANVGTNQWSVQVNDDHGGTNTATVTAVIEPALAIPSSLVTLWSDNFHSNNAPNLVEDNVNDANFGPTRPHAPAVQDWVTLAIPASASYEPWGLDGVLTIKDFNNNSRTTVLLLDGSNDLSNADSGFMRVSVQTAELNENYGNCDVIVYEMLNTGTGMSLGMKNDADMAPLGGETVNAIASMNISTNDANSTLTMDFVYTTNTDIYVVFVSKSTLATKTSWIRLEQVQVQIEGLPYEAWKNEYVVTGEPDDDQDNDGLLNLYEYGLGGNPTNGFVDGEIPIFGHEGSGMEYIHAQRSDDPALVYALALTDNLVFGLWTTNTGYTVSGTNVTAGTFDYVTNTIPTVDDATFIKLIIEQL